jgi:hypothetical protein
VARAALAAAALLLLPAPALADLLLLKDGRVVDDVRMQKDRDAILVLYRNGVVRVPMELVEDYVIEGVAFPEPATDEERARRAEGLVKHNGKWVPVAVRDKAVKKQIEARLKSIEEYKKHREWRNRYQFKTKVFDFESNLPEAINEDFSEMLEVYYREFAKLWKVQVPREWGRLKICFYASRAEFQRTSGAPRNALAYYRFVDPRELNFFYDRHDPSYSVACLFHEANHYVTDLLGGGFQYPHWVNEAMAEYYGAAVWDPATKSMTMGRIQDGRLADIRADMVDKKDYPLRKLLTSTRGDYEHYTWGWSFVHFMMETPKYRTKWMRFFNDLARAPDVDRRHGGDRFSYLKSGDECLRVFLSRTGLKEKDLDGLEKEWLAHLEAMGEPGLQGLEKGGMRAFQDGRWRFRAPRLLKEAMDKGSRKPHVWAQYAMCLFLKKDEAVRPEVARVLERATELDPLDGYAWSRRGYLTYGMGNKEEGERMLALAEEMDPEGDYPPADAWLQFLEHFGEGE